MTIRQLGALWVSLALVASLPVSAQIPGQVPEPIAPPADPAFCAQPNSFAPTAKAFMLAMSDAGNSGRLSPDQFQKLSVWFIAMQNWMIETNEVRRTCEALIQARRQNGF